MEQKRVLPVLNNSHTSDALKKSSLMPRQKDQTLLFLLSLSSFFRSRLSLLVTVPGYTSNLERLLEVNHWRKSEHNLVLRIADTFENICRQRKKKDAKTE